MTKDTRQNESFLITSRHFSKDLHLLTNELNSMYIEISTAVNNRAIGFFQLNQTSTGSIWIDEPNPINKKSIYRKLFPFQEIGSGDSLEIPIEVQGITNVIKLDAMCSTVFEDYKPIPFCNIDESFQNVEIYIKDGIINILNGAESAPIIKGNVIIEYLLN